MAALADVVVFGSSVKESEELPAKLIAGRALASDNDVVSLVVL